jgi:hypothetical protein
MLNRRAFSVAFVVFAVACSNVAWAQYGSFNPPVVNPGPSATGDIDELLPANGSHHTPGDITWKSKGEGTNNETTKVVVFTLKNELLKLNVETGYFELVDSKSATPVFAGPGQTVPIGPVIKTTGLTPGTYLLKARMNAGF